VNLGESTEHCGECGTVCEIPNALESCKSGDCIMDACLDNFVDLNNDVSDGCECEYKADLDEPDSNFVDSNCDGFDGDPSIAVFVSAKYGKTNNSGSMQAPLQSIDAAITKAANDPTKKHVYLDKGLHITFAKMKSGVSVFGGFSAENNWQRSSAYILETQIVALDVVAYTEAYMINKKSGYWARTGLRGKDITEHTVIGGMSITTEDSEVNGLTNYGIYCNNCPKLVIDDCIIEAGSGGPGFHGTSGADGKDGGDAVTLGFIACGKKTGNEFIGKPTDYCDKSLLTEMASVGYGGMGGASPYGTDGEDGGYGTKFSFENFPLGGKGGKWGLVGQDGKNGQTSTNKGSMSDKIAGGGGHGYTNSNGYWKSYKGAKGEAGGCGITGGGGGGGGSTATNPQCCNTKKTGEICDGKMCIPSIVIEMVGAAGGGGGGGGWGGNGGEGGYGGGASFGVFLFDSAGAVISNSTINAGNGGKGGNCGPGGKAGAGGEGSGGAIICGGKGGNGGDGGDGTAGGKGRAGGGGAGGKSFAVYMDKTTFEGTTFENNAYTHLDGGIGGACSLGKAGQVGTTGNKGYFNK
jgi:hypothetical protein